VAQRTRIGNERDIQLLFGSLSLHIEKDSLKNLNGYYRRLFGLNGREAIMIRPWFLIEHE
jgi:hypothetical protein